MSTLWNDFRFALRSLRKSPAFALTAVATIALGIGASTAIFSVVNAVLLRPLPYSDQARLVSIWGDLTARNVVDFPMPPGDLYDLRQQGTLFEQTAAIVTFRQSLRNQDGESELVPAAGVTTNFFATLGARIVQGRDFQESDGTPQPQPPQAPQGQAAPAGPPAQLLPTYAIISHGLWQRRFGGGADVVGQRLQLGNQSAEIIGVLEPGFEVLFPASVNVERRPDIYTALRIDLENASRINVFLRTVGRLKPGVTIEQAQSQINTLVADLRRRFPIKETAGLRWRVEPMHGDLTADVRPTIMALMGAVIFVLLIACANVANLLLVRASVRERELAVRSALGGSRGTLIRQMLVESVSIAGLGALIGLGLAWAGIRLLLSIGPDNLPRLDYVALDPKVLGFTALASLAAAVFFGLVPAIRASRVDVADILRTGGRNSGLAAGKTLRNAVVAAEVALAFVLLVGSGLMIRSFIAIHRADPGYDPRGVFTFWLPNLGRPTPEARAAFVQQLGDRLSGLPGVTAVSSAGPLPLDGQTSNVRWGPEAAAADPSLFQQANLHVVQPGYFEAMKTRLVEGRTFARGDNVPGQHLVVVDVRLAQKAFPGQSALGKQILMRTGGPEPELFQIIGVVGHQRHETLAADGREAVFLPDAFFGFGATGRWIVRTSGDPVALAQPVRAAIREIDRSLAVTDLQPMQAMVDRARAPTRFALVLIGIFAGIAVLLAAVGLYGVLSTTVRQRTSEIGVRMAFGADRGTILRLIVGQGLKLSVVGVVLGVIAAVGLTRIMRSMLVGVGATDPLTFATMTVLFLALATVACWVPARRAARLDPNEALRDE
ncbi:MAG TPA: ABC transporter permease [Gemmatimonadales bacterium]|nr:ABC transporter permease [Gemmatimonadales bacterium]